MRAAWLLPVAIAAGALLGGSSAQARECTVRVQVAANPCPARTITRRVHTIEIPAGALFAAVAKYCDSHGCCWGFANGWSSAGGAAQRATAGCARRARGGTCHVVATTRGGYLVVAILGGRDDAIAIAVGQGPTPEAAARSARAKLPRATTFVTIDANRKG